MSGTRTSWALLLLVIAVATNVAAQEQPAVAGSGAEPGDGGDYRVGIGDVISVKAFQEEEISGDFPVESSGAITFPLLGSVPVAGMTPAEVSSTLEISRART